MACGVHLGILLICLVQAEHVWCLWASQARSNAYVGSSQQDRGLKRLRGSSPQNQFRQASVSIGSAQSSERETEVIDGQSQRFSSSGLSRNIPQPAHKSQATIRLVESSLESKPAKRKTNWLREHFQKGVEKKSFNLYNQIASGSSISNYKKQQNSQTNEGQLTWSSKYLLNDGASGPSHALASPSRPQSAVNKRPAYYEQRGSSSSLSSAGAASLQPNSTRSQTSVCGLGRRVSSHRHSKAREPSRFLLPVNITRNIRSQAKAGNPYQLPESRGSYNRFNMASNHGSDGQDLPEPSHKQNALLGLNPDTLHTHTSLGRGSSKPSCPFARLVPSSASSSWNRRNPIRGAHKLPVFGSSGERAPTQRFAPSQTYSIHPNFGGSIIRRMKKPADQGEVGLMPQQTGTYPPQQLAPYKPQLHKVPQSSRWIRIKPGSLRKQVQQNESHVK